ncbi:hypothetical protein GQR58_022651 [Nymphon striatum]|nr:hypothetical protein GQR58_022651 [Nymphon striatum]
MSNSRSPFVSPGASPQVYRRGQTVAPPPIPPRYSIPSPIVTPIHSPSSSPSTDVNGMTLATNSITVSNGTTLAANSITVSNVSSNSQPVNITIITQPPSNNYSADVMYADIRTVSNHQDINRNSLYPSVLTPPASSSSDSTSNSSSNNSLTSQLPPSLPSSQRQLSISVSNNSSLHYAELTDIQESIGEPNYANTELNSVSSVAPVRSTSLTTSSINHDYSFPSEPPPPIPPSQKPSTSSSQHDDKRSSSLIYLSMLENKEKDNVSYENLHMDYIAQLTSEGYSQESVIRALGISRNDIEMARDILHEFAKRK